MAIPTSAHLRRRLAARAANSGFHALSFLGRLHPRAKPERQGVERIRDIPYRSDSRRRAHRLDLYKPLRHPGPWPVVFYVHGGGFQSLSKDTHWLMGLGFARRGYLVVNVSYRLAPRHPFPAPLADVCDAFAFAVDNLERWGGDPARLSLAGESAGANLVAALAVAASYRRSEPWATKVFDAAEAKARPRVVLASCGIHQVSDTARFRRRDPNVRRFATAIIEDVEHCYLPNSDRAGHPIDGPLAMADPLIILEQGVTPDVPLPAFHLSVGTADPLLDDTRRMAAALDRLGTPNEAAYFKGQPHAFHVAIHTRAARRCWREMYAFLDMHAGPLGAADTLAVAAG